MGVRNVVVTYRGGSSFGGVVDIDKQAGKTKPGTLHTLRTYSYP